jgi:hypothetical protein
MDLQRVVKKCLVGLIVMLAVGVQPSYGVLIQDNGLILDTESGLRWAPVGRGVLEPDDLIPGFRYATSTEVDELLRYLPNDSCINVAPSTPCGSQTVQETLDFIDIFQSGLPNRLRAIYDPVFGPPGSGMAMALNLFVNLQTQFITFDTQGVNFPPASLDDGMFLVLIAIPELSTLLLMSSGALVGLWYSRKKI